VHDVHLGLPDAGRDDHRPVEPERARASFRDVLLRPKSCPLYRAGPTRKVPGRKGMSWEEEDWVDEEATEDRGPDD
jgi:hypothetical protein